jgi:hypothetical protein
VNVTGDGRTDEPDHGRDPLPAPDHDRAAEPAQAGVQVLRRLGQERQPSGVRRAPAQRLVVDDETRDDLRRCTHRGVSTGLSSSRRSRVKTTTAVVMSARVPQRRGRLLHGRHSGLATSELALFHITYKLANYGMVNVI